MFAAAAPNAPAPGGLPFGWFDLVVVVVLGFGVYRGRRNGMSKELLLLVQWLVLLPVCGFGYLMVAGLFSELFKDLFWSRLLSYLALAALVFSIFKLLRRQLDEKLVKSDFFRGSEYYLGMVSGIIRYACGLVFALALLNAPFYSTEDIARQNAFDQKNFGGGLYSGNYFPHVFTVQNAVFKDSFLGPLIKTNLGVLLINTAGSSSESPGTHPAEPPKKKPVIIIG
jgi:uncharacterized membrane protein required for colicin V production